MAEPAIALNQDVQKQEDAKYVTLPLRKIKDIIHNTHSDELIISLCGFIGTDIHKVAKRLKYILENIFDYKADIVELSSHIKEKAPGAKGISRQSMPYYEYIKKLIDGGNDLRKEFGNSILTELAVQKIAFDRHTAKGSDEAYQSRRHCYIIDSIKNVEELELVKIVYRDIHYSIGVFSNLDARRQNLKSKGITERQIDSLIDRDSGEEIAYGQKVRDTFTQSDFFLRLDSYSQEELDSRLERFLHLVFSTKVITPTVEETAMYQASSAAGNSACLSRQVGAALTDSRGEILSIGWNDVPKYGGSLYQANFLDPLAKNDYRCFSIGMGCWNDKEKNIISQELVNILVEEKLIPEEKRMEVFSNSESKIKELIEFSRTKSF